MTDNDALENALLQFAEDVLQEAKEHSKQDSLPKIKAYRTEFEKTAYRMTDVERPLYSKWFRDRLGKKWDYPNSARNCARMHFDAAIFKLPAKKEGPIHEALREITEGTYQPREYTYEDIEPAIINRLIAVMIEAVDKSGGLAVAHEDLIGTYRKYRAIWEKRTVKRLFTAPLVGFTTDMDRIPLNEQWVIIRFDDNYKNTLWNISGSHDSLVGRYIDTSDYSSCAYVLCATKDVRVEDLPFPVTNDNRVYTENAREIFLIVTALRLTKDSECGVAVVIDTDADMYGGIVGAQGLPLTRSRQFGQSLSLNKTEVERFLKVFHLLDNHEKSGHLKQLDNALRRFNLAYQRDDFADCLVDVAIALDSSVLQGQRNELNLRLQVRGSSILADRFQPSETQKLLKALYNTRSNIVHEGLSFEEAGARRVHSGNIRQSFAMIV